MPTRLASSEGKGKGKGEGKGEGKGKLSSVVVIGSGKSWVVVSGSSLIRGRAERFFTTGPCSPAEQAFLFGGTILDINCNCASVFLSGSGIRESVRVNMGSLESVCCFHPVNLTRPIYEDIFWAQ